VPEGEPCPYCAHLAPNPEELRQHLLHLHPEVAPEPDWWDRDTVAPPVLWNHHLSIDRRIISSAILRLAVQNAAMIN